MVWLLVILILKCYLLISSHKLWFYDSVNELNKKKKRPSYICFINNKMDIDKKLAKNWKIAGEKD